MGISHTFNHIQYLEISEMMDENDLIDTIACESLAPRDTVAIDNIESNFERVHIKFPFLPVNPICSSNNQVYIASAYSNADLVVPNNAILMRLKGNRDFLMGSCDVDRLTSNVQDGSAPVLNPDGWYYCGGKSSINIMSMSDDCLVTCEFYLG